MNKSQDQHRVVITSMGAVSPIGTGEKEFFNGLEASVRGVENISFFDTTHFPCNIAAEAKKNQKTIQSDGEDRKAIFLNQSLNELMEKGVIQKYSPVERLMILGVGMDYFRLEEYAECHQKCDWQDYSDSIKKTVQDLSAQKKISGGTFVNVSACVASSQAIGLAFRILKSNEKKVVIAGGVDSMLNHLHYMGFYKLQALSAWTGDPAESCRPFDKNRKGLVLGEGSALFTLENRQYVEPENVLAEITGYHSTMDAFMVTDPNPDGEQLAEAAIAAIEESNISPDDIDFVHCHGTGTLKNDIAECEALKKIFGSRSDKIPVFSLKSRVGHLIAACGSIEVASIIYSLKNQVVPATLNYVDPDPAISLNVQKKPLKTNINYVLKLNAAFGGQNTAIVIKKHD